MPKSSWALPALKLVHTIVWAFFVVCIVGIPLASWRNAHGLALGLVGVVLGESLVLLVNRWRCPLTTWAARYTDDRRPNFDIYLPRWLAEHNQLIFGTLFAAGTIFALLRWSLSASRN